MWNVEGSTFEDLFEKVDEFLTDVGKRVERCMDKVADSKTFETVTSTVDEVASELTKATKKVIKRIIK